jgi:hypothetical protein
MKIKRRDLNLLTIHFGQYQAKCAPQIVIQMDLIINCFGTESRAQRIQDLLAN